MGQVAGSTGDIAKLENQVATYKVRKGLYYILATQDGQITQLTKAGIGEIVKDAETIGIIVRKDRLHRRNLCKTCRLTAD